MIMRNKYRDPVKILVLKSMNLMNKPTQISIKLGTKFNFNDDNIHVKMIILVIMPTMMTILKSVGGINEVIPTIVEMNMRDHL